MHLKQVQQNIGRSLSRQGLCPGIMSFTKLLHGFSFGCFWVNCVVSLHRSRTSLHPVDICFVNNFFFTSFWPSVYLDALLSKRQSWSLVQQELFFRVCICQKFALPIDDLHVAVCSFSEYAMNLDHSIGHDSFNGREQSVCNKKY